MIFIPVLIAAIYFYFTDKRISSGMIFCFFLSDGFHVIPLELFDIGIISRPMDFALLYVIITFTLGCLRYNDFLHKDKINKYIYLFIGFIIISIFVSKYEFNVEWEDILKMARYYLFVLAYFPLRRFSREELWTIVNKSFIIITFLCVLYFLQAFSGIQLLTGYILRVDFASLKIRGYNIPNLYYFFLFFSFFTNPFEGKKKYISMALYIMVVILSLHRGLLLPVFGLSFLGIYYTQNGLRGIVRYLFIGGIVMIPFVDIIIERFESDNSSEFSSIMEGSFIDYDETEIEGTILFRVALFAERYEYVTRDLTTTLFGVGFMHEESKLTEKKFDFKVGLKDEKGERIIQLETGDTAWVPFLLRLGLIGTIIYLSLCFFLTKTFYRKRHDKNMLVAFLYMVLLFLYSFTSFALSNPFMIIFPYIYYILQGYNNEDEIEGETINKALP